jgi:hypothetical protein
MRCFLAVSLLLAVSLPSSAASAAVVLITQAKAIQGGVTEGDAPGFPVTLNDPGAYRLETNLTVPAGAIGITVRSHYVDIDMNGFRLYGWNAAGTQRVGSYGVYATFGVSRIHDGFISGFRNDGINLTGNSNQWVIENMIIQSNGGSGIRASSYTRIVGNTIDTNVAYGVFGLDFVHVERNLIASNGYRGVRLESGMLVENTIAGNADYGLWDNGVPDTGLSNNIFINNNPTGSNQLAGGVQIHPNACTGNPC